MKNDNPLIDEIGEVRELTTADMAQFQPATTALPLALQQKLGVRGPQKAPVKERITIRLSPEVVAQFRDTGEGWQTRIDIALKNWLQTNSPTELLVKK